MFYATTSWIKIFDAKSLTLIKQLDEPIKNGSSDDRLQISQDHQRILLVQNSQIKVVDFDGKEIFSTPLSNNSSSINAKALIMAGGVDQFGDTSRLASLSPDGTKIAFVKDCTYTGAVFAACETDVVDIDTGKTLLAFPGKDPIISPDGSLIATKLTAFAP